MGGEVKRLSWVKGGGPKEKQRRPRTGGAAKGRGGRGRRKGGGVKGGWCEGERECSSTALGASSFYPISPHLRCRCALRPRPPRPHGGVTPPARPGREPLPSWCVSCAAQHRPAACPAHCKAQRSAPLRRRAVGDSSRDSGKAN